MDLLKPGDTIGILSPSGVADKTEYAVYAKGLEQMGFRVKFGRNIHKDTYKSIANVKERVDDLNEMVYDRTVKLIFFDGGCGSVDLLPYINYRAIRENPKLFLRYSDGTSILNAVYAQTGMTAYYGQTPNSPYRTDRDHILFIEELEGLQSVEDTGMFLTCVGQSRLMERVTGLLFGHFSEQPSPLLFELLERFGKNHHIPVAYCDDFGHGANHAIFPIGRAAFFDTREQILLFQQGKRGLS